MRLRLVSWNIHSCVGADGRYDPERIARVLRGLDADIIGLQEVDWRKPDIDGLHQFGYLAHSLGMTPVEGPNLEDHSGHYGNGLLTRLPVAHVDRLELAHPGREPRGLIDVELDASSERDFGDDGQRLRVLVTHLGLARTERKRQVHRIREHLKAGSGSNEAPEHGPDVLMGDRNEWVPRRFRSLHGLHEWFNSEVAPRTFPSRAPLARLDRILTGPRVRATPIGLPRAERSASDHRPVVVEIRSLNDESWYHR